MKTFRLLQCAAPIVGTGLFTLVLIQMNTTTFASGLGDESWVGGFNHVYVNAGCACSGSKTILCDEIDDDHDGQIDNPACVGNGKSMRKCSPGGFGFCHGDEPQGTGCTECGSNWINLDCASP